MKKWVVFFLNLGVAVWPAFVQGQWARTFGGKGNDEAACVQQTPEGGFIVVGTAESFGKTNKNIWMFKLSAAGTILWQKYFGAEPESMEGGDNLGLFVQTTRDNGLIVTGEVAGYVRAGNQDLIAIKLDAKGRSRWVTGVADRDVGYHSFENGQAVVQTSDGGYLFTGFRNIRSYAPNDAEPSSYKKRLHGNLFVFKTDSLGNGKWGGLFGGGNEIGRSILETPDGGFIAAGITETYGAGASDAWVLKFGKNRGNLEWHCAYGGADIDEAHEIRRTADGGYIVSGPTKSFGAGDYDIWILKISGKGKILWQKTYGGPKADYAHSVYPTADGGFIVAGSTASFGSGDYDCWVLRLDAKGAVVWEKAYGGTAYDGAFAVRPLKAGGFIVAGRTRSYGAGANDALVMKLAANGKIDPSCGLFVRDTKATVLRGRATAAWAAGEGGCDSFQDWWPVGWSLLKDTNGANTVICKK